MVQDPEGRPIVMGKPREFEYSSERGLTIKGLTLLEAMGVLQALDGVQATLPAPAPVPLVTVPPADTEKADNVQRELNAAVAASNRPSKEPPAEAPRPKRQAEEEPERPRPSARAKQAEEEPERPRPSARAKQPEEEAKPLAREERQSLKAAPAPVQSMTVSKNEPEEKWFIDLDNIPSEITEAKSMRGVVMYFWEVLGEQDPRARDPDVIYREFVRLGRHGAIQFFKNVRNAEEKIRDAITLFELT